MITNRLIVEVSNTVYDRIQQLIEYLKETYGTKPTEATTQKTFYDNHSETAPPASVTDTYKNLATNYLAAQHIL